MTGPSGNSSFFFPQISMFPLAVPRGNIEFLRKQNELFPEGPVIKCLKAHLHPRRNAIACYCFESPIVYSDWPTNFVTPVCAVENKEHRH